MKKRPTPGETWVSRALRTPDVHFRHKLRIFRCPETETPQNLKVNRSKGEPPRGGEEPGSQKGTVMLGQDFAQGRDLCQVEVAAKTNPEDNFP
jgi:hypothetical protein